MWKVNYWMMVQTSCALQSFDWTRDSARKRQYISTASQNALRLRSYLYKPKGICQRGVGLVQFRLFYFATESIMCLNCQVRLTDTIMCLCFHLWQKNMEDQQCHAAWSWVCFSHLKEKYEFVRKTVIFPLIVDTTKRSSSSLVGV
jgi:hypothetical protein